MADNLKSENQALWQLKALENTLINITDKVKKCEENEKKIKQYEESLQKLLTGVDEQRKRADSYETQLKKQVEAYKLQGRKLELAEERLKVLLQRVSVQPQGRLQLAVKRIAPQMLPEVQQKVPNLSQENPHSGQYVNWNLIHERDIQKLCYISSKLLEISVIEAIKNGCIVDTSISTMYRVNRFTRYPDNGKYLGISINALANAKCMELITDCAVNVMSQNTLKALVDLLSTHYQLYSNYMPDRVSFEMGNGLTWCYNK